MIRYEEEKRQNEQDSVTLRLSYLATFSDPGPKCQVSARGVGARLP